MVKGGSDGSDWGQENIDEPTTRLPPSHAPNSNRLPLDTVPVLPALPALAWVPHGPGHVWFGFAGVHRYQQVAREHESTREVIQEL